MPTRKVFIDGSSGTTGLRIREYLQPRRDIEIIELAAEKRRDPSERKAAHASADVAILCLPDEAAREVAGWVDGTSTRLIDASTAHRVADGWTYGMPEMAPGQREAIRSAQKVSNPGCWATCVILSLRPLVSAGVLRKDAPIAVHGISGYSGGGKAMIARWEEPSSPLQNLPFSSLYALETQHKHIPEMTRYTGLDHRPHFIPSVGPFNTGMRVEIPLHLSMLAGEVDGQSVWESLNDAYAAETFVRVAPLEEGAAHSEPAFDPRSCNGTNRIDISVIPNAIGHVLLIMQVDNLGKGAAGAAVQNLNLMLGFEEGAGLSLGGPPHVSSGGTGASRPSGC